MIKPIKITDEKSAAMSLYRLEQGDDSGMELTQIVYPHLGLRDEVLEDEMGNVFVRN